MLTVLFFGGWQIPWIDGEGYCFWQWSGHGQGPGSPDPRAQCPENFNRPAPAAKFTVFLCVWVYMLFMIRWTYPRVRYDQLMKWGGR